jgi:hypothetical protein
MEPVPFPLDEVGPGVLEWFGRSEANRREPPTQAELHQLTTQCRDLIRRRRTARGRNG